MELIDKEKLIEDIYETADKQHLEVDTDAIELVKSQPTVNTWISVDTFAELPDVFVGFAYGEYAICHKESTFIQWFSRNGSGQFGIWELPTPIKYMPISEYKESE